MVKGELQTEDGFQIVSTKQEPSLVNVKTEPEDDTESYAPFQQNIKSEIETYQELGGKSEPNFNTDVKKEPEDDNPDRCIVCNEGLAANQKCGSGSETSFSQPQSTTDISSTVRRNPSRSAKRNIQYRGDLKEDNSLNGKILYERIREI